MSRFRASGTLSSWVTSAKPHIRLVEPDEPSREEAPPAGLEAAFERYAPYVASIGLRMLGRRDEADDLVQDVFLAAARGLDQVKDPHATKAWLATVAVRTARKRLRRRRLRMMLSLESEVDYGDVADDRASPETRALLCGVYRALDRLPVDERLAWTLRHVEGEKLERVALLCDCSLATVKRRIARAHQTIRKAVDA